MYLTPCGIEYIVYILTGKMRITKECQVYFGYIIDAHCGKHPIMGRFL
jgi:hypothetical protein